MRCVFICRNSLHACDGVRSYVLDYASLRIKAPITESHYLWFEGATERPIIFVCHSLGGIIVKEVFTSQQEALPSTNLDFQALAYSASRTSKQPEHLHSVFISTYGMVFLGTPHNGSDVAKMSSTAQRLVSAVVPKKVSDTHGQLLNALKEDSETLQNITDQFAPLMKRFHKYVFWEQEKNRLPHTNAYVCCLSYCLIDRPEFTEADH